MPGEQPRGLFWRALGALALMIGFYGLAIAVIALLWFGAYAQIRYGNRVHGRYLIFAAVATIVILAGILPRRDKFIAPGVLLDENKHPRLFKELRAIADAVEQTMPREVYLVPDFNAGVMERGGRGTLGGRRLMLLGLPLLNLLNVSQMRGVIAHEFGHFYGGDTKLGPIIYRTRSAISRTVAGLARQRSILQIPFEQYGKMYLRITHGISRQQEYAADRLAAGVAGSGPLAEGLEKIHEFAPACSAFWENEYMPILASGHYAPLVEGLSKFMEDPKVKLVSGKVLEEAKASAAVSPYDTHPPLKDRVDAIKGLPAAGVATDTSSAISLLEDVQEAERELAAGFMARYSNRRLIPIAWDEVATKVHLQTWTNLIEARGAWLEGVTAATLPDVLGDPHSLVERYKQKVGQLPSPEAFRQVFTMTVGAALAIQLGKRGWVLNARPALGFTMHKDGSAIAPFSILSRLAAGAMSADDWRRQCAEIGIAEANLGTV
jgi:heat shock protein HtpX